MDKNKLDFYLALTLGLVFILATFAVLRFQKSPPMTPPSTHRAGPVLSKTMDQEVLRMSPERANAVVLGNAIFNQTPRYAREYAGDALSCTQCHLSGGQQKGILGLVGVAPQYPDYDPRAGKEITLQQRIQSCFLRSENGKAPPLESQVMKNMTEYITALSHDQPAGQSPPWRDLDRIPPQDQIPIGQLNPTRGKQLYGERCAACHGVEGKPLTGIPPLWGPQSFNDGAGFARVYALAAFIREAMPLGDSKSLSLVEAQEIAAYIDSQDRPVFLGKEGDYPDGKIPVDAVYYKKRYPKNPLRP